MNIKEEGGTAERATEMSAISDYQIRHESGWWPRATRFLCSYAIGEECVLL